MKQFDLKEYLKDLNKKVVTRDGRDVRIICTNKLDKFYPIIALVNYDGVEDCYGYTVCGKINIYQDIDCDLDLLFVPEKKEKWVNVYEDSNGRNWLGENLYDTEKAAKADPSKSRVAIVKIEWEE